MLYKTIPFHSNTIQPMKTIEGKVYDKSGYEKIEDNILDKMESVISIVDNYAIIQAIFPGIERITKNNSYLKIISYGLKQAAKIYIIMILIYLKKFLLRISKINKLIKLVKIESRIVKIPGGKYKEWLSILKSEKIRSIIEIIGYINELMLNLTLVYKNVRFNKFFSRLMGIVSWIVNFYRNIDNEENENTVRGLEIRYGI